MPALYNLRELFDNCDSTEQAIKLFDKKYPDNPNDNIIDLLYVFHYDETDLGEVACVLLEISKHYNIEYYEVLDYSEWDLTAVAIRVARK